MPGESLHVRREAGVEMIIAIDSTLRGPALGGCRWRTYSDSLAARREAQGLARAMTRKAAMARLSLGGGKAVVVGDPGERTRDDLLAFGDFVSALGGRYITAADMGTGEEAMATIAEKTHWVAGLPRRLGGPGDPGPFTAEGLELAIERACHHLDLPLAGARVAVQGVGHVGAHLVRLLLAAGADVIAADVSPEALDDLPPGVARVGCDEILREPCTVLAPCGPGAVIDSRIATELRCRIICGAANNPLTGPEVALTLARLGILYAPDFVVNAGGLIRLAVSLDGGDEETARDSLGIIAENLDAVLFLAKAEQIDSAEAAERLARGRISTRGSCG